MRKQKLKDIPVYTEQPHPLEFLRLYLIPETYTVNAPRKSANDSLYIPSNPNPALLSASSEPRITARPTLEKPEPLEGQIAYFKRRIQERIQLAIAEAWSATKAFGRGVVRWLAWRVLMPLSVMASIWVPSVTPAELPW